MSEILKGIGINRIALFTTCKMLETAAIKRDPERFGEIAGRNIGERFYIDNYWKKPQETRFEQDKNEMQKFSMAFESRLGRGVGTNCRVSNLDSEACLKQMKEQALELMLSKASLSNLTRQEREKIIDHGLCVGALDFLIKDLME